MNEPPMCLRCETPMQPGFVPDKEHAGCFVSRWCPGPPQSGWFGSEVRSGQFREGTPIATYRCPACGYLESYAPVAKA